MQNLHLKGTGHVVCPYIPYRVGWETPGQTYFGNRMPMRGFTPSPSVASTLQLPACEKFNDDNNINIFFTHGKNIYHLIQ